MSSADETLLERWIAARDAEAFSEIVSRHAGLVYGVCRRIARNDADAEDLAQDCFLKLAGVGYVPRSSLAGWLHTVASRVATDLLRSRSRRRDRERRFADVEARERLPDPSWVELEEHVDACIAELPPALREVIVAHFLERKTHEAVATELGVSRQTVTHRIHKGIERLRLRLRKRGVTAGAALAPFLDGLPVEAAPASLLAPLGRLALAGPPVSMAATAAVFPAILKLGGFIVAKKLLLSAVAALALVLIVGLTVFRGLSRPPEQASVSSPTRTPPANGPGFGARTAPGLRANRERTETTKAGAASLLQSLLAGTVLDADGHPVAAARVVAAKGQPGEAKKVVETTCDDAGKFRLDPLERDETVVWAFKRGAGLGTAAAAGDVLEIVLEPLCQASGRFYDRDTGDGIAGLAVRLSPLDSRGVAPEIAAMVADAWTLFPELNSKNGGTVTDTDGRYALRDVSPIRLFFEFDPNGSEYVLPGYRLQDSRPEVLLAPGERRGDIDFGLQRGGSIAGTVFGPDGAALGEARVELLASHASPFRPALRCDAGGSYRFIGLPPNATYVVSASHDGLAPGESPTIAMPDAGAIGGIDIHLARGNSVRGRIVDDSGLPVAGIDVVLSRLSESDRRSPAYGKTVTGDEGSFSFDGVAPGRHSVRPLSKLHLADEDHAFTMPADRDLSGLELVLHRKAPGFISGRVVDPAGKPVAGFPVSAGLGSKPAAAALTGEDGGFRLENLGDAAAYTITAYSGEYWSARQLAVPLYSTGVTIVVMQRGRIAGRVLDAENGRPVEHFEVRAVFIRTEPGGGENRFHLKWTPFDSRTGEFLIERAEPVEAQIQVRAAGYVEAKSSRFTIPPGETAGEVTIALSRGAAVRGTVLDAESGEPVPGALVRAHQHDAFFPWLLQEAKASYAPRGVWERTMSGADGSFELSGLDPAESIHLVAWKEGYGPAVRSGIAVGQEGSALRLSLGRAATLVIRASFRPIAGESYELWAQHRAEKPWRSAFHASGEARMPGTVEIPGLPPGPYRLTVHSARREGANVSRRLLGEERLEVAPGERREVPLDLDDFVKRFASVAVRVAGSIDPRRVRLQIISGEDPEELYAYGPTPPGPDGRFRFTGLPAGKYVIVAVRDGTEPTEVARLPVDVVERQQREVEMVVE